jgi:hypothetical protein
MRRIFNSIAILGLTVFGTTGCAFFDKKEKADPAEIEFEAKKEEMEREIELLRLERRKIMLQNSLDRLDSLPLAGEEKG